MTKIIYGGRGSGKTTKLIELSAKRGGYIICINKQAASRVFAQAAELGLKIPFPMTFIEFLNKEYYAPGIREVYIDNVEQFLQFVCRDVDLVAITFTPFGPIEKLEIPDSVQKYWEELGDVDWASGMKGDFSNLLGE